jgi:DNA-binding MarR family transcriptional regulator
MDVSANVIAREVLEVVPAVMSTIRTEMRSRRSADLSVMQFRTLVFLNLNPEASLSAAAEYLGLTLPTVSQMINGMVANGLVRREDSPVDRRRVMLSRTSKGQNLLGRALRGTQARLAEILSRLAAEEREAVHQVMQLMEGLFCQPSLTIPPR